MDKIHILLVEDHTIVRKGICALLDKETNIDVVGEAESGREAIRKAEELRPDVILMDISMAGLNGLETTRQLKKLFPEMKVLILSMHANDEYVKHALQAGASGYLVKEAAPADLSSAILAVHRGESFLSPSVSKAVINEYLRYTEKTTEGKESYEKLTTREREILQLIAEGHSVREISELLCVSPKTVETHRAHLQKKLGIHSIAVLTQYAIRKGLIMKDA